MDQKIVKLKAKLAGTLYELLVNTRIDNVQMLDGTLLADKLQEIINAINVREKIVDVDRKIDAASSATELKAQEYTNTQIGLISQTGIPKLMVYPLSCLATEENQTVFNIDLETFDINTDTVFVQSGRTMLSPNYDFTIQGKTIVLTEGVDKDRTIDIYVFKNVPMGEEGSVSGGVISPGSIELDRLAEMPTASDVGALSENVFSERFGSALGYAEDIDEFASTCPIGVSSFRTYSGTKGVPSNYSMWQYTNGLVFRRDADICVVVLFAILENKIAMKSFTNGVWTEWGIFGAGDFLPLSGGTLSGQELFIANGFFRLVGNSQACQIETRNAIGDTNNRRLLVVSNNTSKTLPNSITFNDIIGGTGKSYNIFGEHNKPSGTYTGNGSATRRTIDIGANIHSSTSLLFIYGTDTASHLLVSRAGAIGWSFGDTYSFKSDFITFKDNTLAISSDDATMNGNGKTYYWRVL